MSQPEPKLTISLDEGAGGYYYVSSPRTWVSPFGRTPHIKPGQTAEITSPEGEFQSIMLRFVPDDDDPPMMEMRVKETSQ